MARNNRVSVQGDITGDIHFDVFTKDGRSTTFLRVYLMIKNSHGADEVRGLRIIFYGLLAEEAEAHLQKGSRIEVEGHLQIRKVPGEGVSVEVVAEDVDYIRNITWERGAKRLAEMAAAGKKREVLNPYDEAEYPIIIREAVEV